MVRAKGMHDNEVAEVAESRRSERGRAGRQKMPNAGRQVNQEPLAEGDPVIVGQKEASSTTRV